MRGPTQPIQRRVELLRSRQNEPSIPDYGNLHPIWSNRSDESDGLVGKTDIDVLLGIGILRRRLTGGASLILLGDHLLAVDMGIELPFHRES